jgi:hypothetical protein
MYVRNSSTRTSDGAFTIGQVTAFSYRETGGAVARFTIRRAATNGTILFDKVLAANEGNIVSLAIPVDFTVDGCFLKVESGAVSVTVVGI